MKNFLSLLFLFLLTFNLAFTNPPKNEQIYPTVIVGGGIGSLTSSIYLSRAQILPLVIEGDNPGGVITQSHLVQNWPGEIGISGQALSQKLKKQAIANGAEFLAHEVIDVDFSDKVFIITTKDLYTGKTSKIKAYSCILAMGTTPNYLHIPGEQNYWGKGVTNCATCDGALYKNREVLVVGGGDAAILEAQYLSNICKNVTIIIRKDHFKTQEVRRKQEILAKPNVHVLFETTLDEIKGNGDNVTHATINSQGKKQTLAIDGVFLAIGSKPNSKILQGKVNLDGNGYVLLVDDQKTSVSGTFALGDLCDRKYKQAITAAGDGAKAAMQTEEFLRDLQVEDKSICFKTPIVTDTRLIASPQEISLLPIKEEKQRTLPKIVEISNVQQFQKELKDSRVPVIVDFYATWCNPCKKIASYLTKAALSTVTKVKYLKVNVDKNAGLAQSYQIRSLPTLLIFGSNGKVLTRTSGSEKIIPIMDKLSKMSSVSQDKIEAFLKKQ